MFLQEIFADSFYFYNMQLCPNNICGIEEINKGLRVAIHKINVISILPFSASSWSATASAVSIGSVTTASGSWSTACPSGCPMACALGRDVSVFSGVDS